MTMECTIHVSCKGEVSLEWMQLGHVKQEVAVPDAKHTVVQGGDEKCKAGGSKRTRSRENEEEDQEEDKEEKKKKKKRGRDKGKKLHCVCVVSS